ncbi:MAG: aspartate/tyrosine/aromatic aminotransferase [Gammaproteobacteria bacterium]|nr:aspartate/tyrosine/aromatic aminotransferase [Gammaproteobacteria bacterium]
MFSELKPVKTDPILGLMAAFREDKNPLKIDLGVGVYKDEQGHTGILNCVKTAERYRLENETTKTYMGMAGDLAYNARIAGLIFGDEHKVMQEDRTRIVQAPGGTGALRVAAEFIKRCNPQTRIWVSTPTWANHLDLFAAAGLQVLEYPYYDYQNHGLLFDEMMAALQEAGQGDVVLLHACCHNPSGMDLNPQQWSRVSDLAREKGFTPLIDIAYQGFGHGLDEDALGVRVLADALPELIVCSSCSKNFGLYRERIGACSVISRNSREADIVFATLQNTIRGIYSMPPAHGAAIVNTILSSSELTAEWHHELAEMRDRINGLRGAIADKLAEKGAPRDFGFIQRQNGMFSFLGISPEQVQRLRDDYSIYMVGSSRMNVAGISRANIDYFAEAVVNVMKEQS